jgi:hypothetical protein
MIVFTDSKNADGRPFARRSDSWEVRSHCFGPRRRVKPGN